MASRESVQVTALKAALDRTRAKARGLEVDLAQEQSIHRQDVDQLKVKVEALTQERDTYRRDAGVEFQAESGWVWGTPGAPLGELRVTPVVNEVAYYRGEPTEDGYAFRKVDGTTWGVLDSFRDSKTIAAKLAECQKARVAAEERVETLKRLVSTLVDMDPDERPKAEDMDTADGLGRS